MNEVVMTGRDLMIYILANGLEDKPVFENGRLVGFMNLGETAAKFNVGPATVRVWINEGKLPGIKIGDEIYIPANAENPSNMNDITVNIAGMIPTIPPLSISPLKHNKTLLRS